MPEAKRRTNVHLDYSHVEYIDELREKWLMTSRSAVMTHILNEHKRNNSDKTYISMDDIKDTCVNGLHFFDLIKLSYFISNLIQSKLFNGDDESGKSDLREEMLKIFPYKNTD